MLISLSKSTCTFVDKYDIYMYVYYYRIAGNFRGVQIFSNLPTGNSKNKNHKNFNQATFIAYRNVVYVRVRVGVWSELGAHTMK